MDEVKVIRTRSELGELAGVWNAFVDRCPGGNVFLTWEWISNWVEVYLPEDRLLTVVISDGGAPRAIAPLCVQEKRFVGGAKIKVLRFLGSGEVCADHLDMMVTGDREGEWSRRIWDELFGPLRREWDVFEYYDAPGASSILEAFGRFAKKDTRCIKSESVGDTICPYLDLPGSWEEFLEQCGGTRRYTISYSMRKLAEQGNLEKRFCEKADEVDGFMEAFISLHQKSWNARGKPGAFSSTRFAEFHRRVAKEFLEKGVLFLCSFHLDGRHVGSFYGFQYGGTVSYYLLGVETNPVKRVKTGTAVLGHCIEEAIRRGCKEFDFLRGDEEYKYRWTSTDRRNPRVQFFNRTAPALVYLVGHVPYLYAQRILKVLLGRRFVHLKRLVRR